MKQMPTLAAAKDRFVAGYVMAVLRQTKRNIPETARVLGIDRPNVYRLIRRYNLDIPLHSYKRGSR